MKSLQSITAKPWTSLGVYLAVFFISATFLHLVDFFPEAPLNEETAETNIASGAGASLSQQVVREAETETQRVVETETGESQYTASEEPRKIVIPKIGVNTPIVNPASTNLEVLDNALLQGAVRYPGSGLLGQNATVFLFGHQSGLPVVRNQAFKAFNDLQNLVVGDSIYVSSGTAEYEYRVRSVTLVNADDALIPLSDTEGNLMLSTCNSFGDPGERYVVDAELVTKRTL